MISISEKCIFSDVRSYTDINVGVSSLRRHYEINSGLPISGSGHITGIFLVFLFPFYLLLNGFSFCFLFVGLSVSLSFSLDLSLSTLLSSISPFFLLCLSQMNDVLIYLINLNQNSYPVSSNKRNIPLVTVDFQMLTYG